MNENNILEIFYKMLDENRFDDINQFKTVEKVHNYVDMLHKRYKRIDEILDLSNEQSQEECLLKLKNQWQQVDTLRKSIDGAFFDIQEYYFMQGFKASMELREQLKRLLDNKESERVKDE